MRNYLKVFILSLPIIAGLPMKSFAMHEEPLPEDHAAEKRGIARYQLTAKGQESRIEDIIYNLPDTGTVSFTLISKHPMTRKRLSEGFSEVSLLGRLTCDNQTIRGMYPEQTFQHLVGREFEKLRVVSHPLQLQDLCENESPSIHWIEKDKSFCLRLENAEFSIDKDLFEEIEVLETRGSRAYLTPAMLIEEPGFIVDHLPFNQDVTVYARRGMIERLFSQSPTNMTPLFPLGRCYWNACGFGADESELPPFNALPPSALKEIYDRMSRKGNLKLVHFHTTTDNLKDVSKNKPELLQYLDFYTLRLDHADQLPFILNESLPTTPVQSTSILSENKLLQKSKPRDEQQKSVATTSTQTTPTQITPPHSGSRLLEKSKNGRHCSCCSIS